jgi:arylsulfatase A-like enzyme
MAVSVGLLVPKAHRLTSKTVAHVKSHSFSCLLLAAVVLVLGSGCSAVNRASPQKRPNILLITTDQQTWNALSASGNPYVRTPAMDRLAAGGVRFELSYCAAPICSPSRAALLTGRLPHETGVDFNQQLPNSNIPNIGQVFQQAGYQTVYAGKWHLPSLYPGCRGETIPGFEVLPLGKPLSTAVKEADLDHADERDREVTDAAVAYLRGRHERPFLLVVSLLNPHDICYQVDGKRHYFSAPDPSVLPPLPPNFDVDPQEPEFVHLRRNQLTYGAQIVATRNWTEVDWRTYLYVYYRLVERVDAEIGRVLQVLSEAGLDGDTLIVFTSDHGEGMATHHWVVKLSLYDSVAKVPVIIRWPGIIPSGRVDHEHLVSGLDVMPTLCDYAGATAPPECRGTSLRSMIERPTSTSREFVVSELATDKERPEVMGRMVRTARYKYIAYSIGRHNEQLFDLSADPGETQNLAEFAALRSVLQRHRALLRDWVNETGDHFPVPN